MVALIVKKILTIFSPPTIKIMKFLSKHEGGDGKLISHLARPYWDLGPNNILCYLYLGPNNIFCYWDLGPNTDKTKMIGSGVGRKKMASF